MFEDPPKSLRLLIAAGEIPLGSTVSKRTGENVYTLGNELRVFFPKADGGPRPEAQKLAAQAGTVFLIGPTGTANAISTSMLILWHVDEYTLSQWLLERIEGPPQ